METVEIQLTYFPSRVYILFEARNGKVLRSIVIRSLAFARIHSSEARSRLTISEKAKGKRMKTENGKRKTKNSMGGNQNRTCVQQKEQHFCSCAWRTRATFGVRTKVCVISARWRRVLGAAAVPVVAAAAAAVDSVGNTEPAARKWKSWWVSSMEGPMDERRMRNCV